MVIMSLVLTVLTESIFKKKKLWTFLVGEIGNFLMKSKTLNFFVENWFSFMQQTFQLGNLGLY